jgi:hypothetical protein
MNATLRRIAVSGSAAVALLSGAAATAVADDHHATVVAIAKTDATPDPNSIGNGLTPDNGSGAALQNPNQPSVNGVNPQQIQTQASGGAIATGVVAIAILGIIVFFRVKGNHLKVGDAVVVVLFGVALAGTVIGGMADQLTDTGVASLSGILGGL